MSVKPFKRSHSKMTIHQPLLLILLQKYPDNRSEAFRECSKQTNITYNTISQYYYNHIFNSDIIIGTTGSNEGFTLNRKNTPVKKGEIFIRQQPLSPIFIILENFIDLSKQDKAALKRIINKL